MGVPEFLQTLSKAYAEHPLAPSLILSHIKRKDGSFAYYAAIHTFPSGFASRNIVCSHVDPDYEACLRGIREVWSAMNILLKEPAPCVSASSVEEEEE